MRTVLALLAATAAFFTLGYFFSGPKALGKRNTANASGGCGCNHGKSGFNSGLNDLGQHYCGCGERANLLGEDAAGGKKYANKPRNPASPAFTDAGEVQANGLVIIPEPRRSFFQPGTVIVQMPASEIVETWMGGLRTGNIVQPTMNRF